MSKIIDINAKKILNSAGKWTIESEIVLEGNFKGRFSVPGGLSKGEREVVSVDANLALEIIEDIKEEFIGKNFNDIWDFDKHLIEYDGTPDKSEFGGNTILSLSGAFCRADAQSKQKELYHYIYSLLNPEIDYKSVNLMRPKMLMLMLEGGEHGSGLATIQEFMLIVNDIELGVKYYQDFRKFLEKEGLGTNVGAEGAFSPNLTNDAILDLMTKIAQNEKIALDVAASSFKDGVNLPNYNELLNRFSNILSIEDPYKENDWNEWENFTTKFKDKIMVVTDDLTTTSKGVLEECLRKNIGNAIIIKPNQIGTISETLDVIIAAHKNNWKTIVSHRGTDTNDDFVSDLAVGTQSEYVKFGAPARGERVAKYNRLLEITKE